MSARKKARKKVKYRKVTLKLSDKQFKSLSNYVDARGTTKTKLIKKMIRPFLNAYEKEKPGDVDVTPNQLNMFANED